MGSNEQKIINKQAQEEMVKEQCEKIKETILTETEEKKVLLETVNTKEATADTSIEQVNFSNAKIADLEAQLAEVQARERDSVLRVKAEMENLRRRTEQDVEKIHKFALERFISELLPVIDNLDRALEVANKVNPNVSSMVEGIELTLKSMMDVIRKFGVEMIVDTNVPLDPNIHQAIAVVESKEVTAGNILSIVQKGYMLNGRTIRAAMVTVAKPCSSKAE